MQQASSGLGHVKSFRNNYLALATTAALLFISMFCHAQYDSTKNRQPINAYGFEWLNAKLRSCLIIPNDTPRLALKDSGALSYKGRKLWTYDGTKWDLVTGIGGNSFDSITVDNGTFCIYNLGASDCFDFKLYFIHVGPNLDTTKILFYNYTGALRDSFALPITYIYAGNRFKITDTLGSTHKKLLSVLTDSTVYKTRHILSDTSFSLCDLSGRCDTFYVGSGSGGGGGASTLQEGFDGSVAVSDNPVIATNGHNLTVVDVGGSSIAFLPNDGHIKLTTTSGKYIRVADDDNDVSLHYDNDYNLKVENGGTTVTGPIFNNADSSTAPVNVVTIDPVTNELKRAAYSAAGITALTGDVTASGTGSVATTLATVNSNIGTFNRITINAKGLATAGSNLAYLLPADTVWLHAKILENTAAILLKLNISDTASMLSPYKTSYPRQAISLTTTGSGASSYNNITGVLNIPTPSTTKVYQEIIATAAQTTFSFTTVPTTSAGFMIYVNGAAVPKTYYSISTNDIIFSAGLVSGDSVVLQGIQ